MKQNKLIFNFFVNRNWKKLTDSRKIAKILADNRKSHNPIETLKFQNDYFYKTSLSRRLLRFHQPGDLVYAQTMVFFFFFYQGS